MVNSYVVISDTYPITGAYGWGTGGLASYPESRIRSYRVCIYRYSRSLVKTSPKYHTFHHLCNTLNSSLNDTKDYTPTLKGLLKAITALSRGVYRILGITLAPNLKQPTLEASNG